MRAVVQLPIHHPDGHLLSGAQVNLYKTGTTSIPDGPIWTSATGATVFANPQNSPATGIISVYFDVAQTVDVKVAFVTGVTNYVSGGAAPSFTAYTYTVDAVSPENLSLLSTTTDPVPRAVYHVDVRGGIDPPDTGYPGDSFAGSETQPFRTIDGALSKIPASARVKLVLAGGLNHDILSSIGMPPPPTATLVNTPGSVDNGKHWYVMTYVTGDGESLPSYQSNVVTITDKTAAGQVVVALPIWSPPFDSPPKVVTQRKLYRTPAGGGPFKLLATIADNTTLSYTDTSADSALGATAPSRDTSLLATNVHVYELTQPLVLGPTIIEIEGRGESVDSDIAQTILVDGQAKMQDGITPTSFPLNAYLIQQVGGRLRNVAVVNRRGPGIALFGVSREHAFERVGAYRCNGDGVSVLGNSDDIVDLGMSAAYRNQGFGLSIKDAPLPADPTGTPVAVDLQTGALVNAGTHKYQVTFVSAWGGETAAGPKSAAVNVILPNKGPVSLTNVPTGDGLTVYRNIYRTTANSDGATAKYVGTIWDNVTTTFTDYVKDLTGTPAPGRGGIEAPTSAAGSLLVPNAVEVTNFDSSLKNQLGNIHVAQILPTSVSSGVGVTLAHMRNHDFGLYGKILIEGAEQLTFRSNYSERVGGGGAPADTPFITIRGSRVHQWSDMAAGHRVPRGRLRARIYRVVSRAVFPMRPGGHIRSGGGILGRDFIEHRYK